MLIIGRKLVLVSLAIIRRKKIAYTPILMPNMSIGWMSSTKS